MALFLWSRPDRHRVGGTRNVWPCTCWRSSTPRALCIEVLARHMERGYRLTCSPPLSSTKCRATSSSGISPSREGVVDFLVADQPSLGPPCAPLSEISLYSRPTPSLQRCCSAPISSHLTSVLVPLRTRLSKVVYRVHLMQAAGVRSQPRYSDFNDFMTSNTHLEIVPCSQTQS
jgi:hypothetical protein